MANQRMYLVCTHCGPGYADYEGGRYVAFTDALYLGKRLESGFYRVHPMSVEEADTFFDRHEWCGDPPDRDHFEVVYDCERG